ncbi:hypothetical protein HDU91_002628, partial [Kappamyces sp. JEL0680]
DKVVCAIEQIYLYMAVCGHRYGCLSTFDQTWFFKREDDTCPSQPRLVVSPAIRCGQTEPYTLMSAWLYMIMTIEKDDGWMCPSMYCSMATTPSISADAHSAGMERYKPVRLDGLVHLQKFIARGDRSRVAVGRFMDLDNVVFKTVDVSKSEFCKHRLDKETEAYEKLKHLQGSVIPRFVAYGTLGGILQVLVLENVGRRLAPEEALERSAEIKAAMLKIQSAGSSIDVRQTEPMVDDLGQIRIIGMA